MKNVKPRGRRGGLDANPTGPRATPARTERRWRHAERERSATRAAAPGASTAPLEQLAQQQILQWLAEATALAGRGVGANGAALRERLTNVLDRSEALDVVLSATSRRHATSEPDEAHTGLPRAAHPAPSEGALNDAPMFALSTSGGEPVSEFLLVPVGEVTVERALAGESFVFTHHHAESAKRWFDSIGRKLAIDYEHQTFDAFNTRADGLRPAAGWIGGLDVRDDGLWAIDVVWTDKARELLRSGEYRYFSPVIFWTDEDCSDVAALGPIALTNDPAMRGVRPLVARRAAVSADAGSRGDGVRIPVGELEDGEASVLRGELATAREELSLLREQLRRQEADAFIERGMRLGKIIDGNSMDWREDYLRDPAAAEQRLARCPVLIPQGRALPLDFRGTVRRLERSTAALGGAARWDVEDEDLAAYERALRAGRVRIA